MKSPYQIFPIGTVRKNGGEAAIEIDALYEKAMLGLEQFSHIFVLYWFHENDTPSKRNTLQVHPRGNPQNPLTGVFATHSPYRPNLIALSVCKILDIDQRLIKIERIDARDGTPVIDLKSYKPGPDATDHIRQPGWARAEKKK